MKTNAKKLMFGLGIALLGSFAAKAQGLEGIIVEKYYQANSTDVTNSINNGATPLLTTGSITYKVYVDLAPGYQYNLTYGDAVHPWVITSSTSFYNDPNNGVKLTPGQSLVNARKNTVMIDSYLTAGQVMNGKVGVLKTEDTDGSIGNTNGALTNLLGGVFGVPINSVVSVSAQDGYVPGTLVNAPNDLGLGSQADIFDSSVGGTFSVTGGSYGVLGGVVGTTTTNAVLIGQFTTDGTFGFMLNVQVQNIATGVAENWVASNPQPGEFSLSSLILAPPTVSITAPANGSNFVTGSTVSITANAAASGSVSQVQFFVDGVSVGTDLVAPYDATYAAVAGTHTITAIVTDNTGATSVSSNVIITAANNQAPVISVTSAPSAVTGDLMTFTATANDVDGTVASVTFSVDNIAIGTVSSLPYTHTWTATFGNHNVKASAVDNLGAIGLSSVVNFAVVNNIPPAVSITSPLNNSSVIAPQVVTITATASDADGTVTMVEAFVNNVSIGTFTTPSPYTWTYVTSTLSAVDNIKVVATDNSAGTTTSTPVNVNVANPNALPYAVGSITEQCNQGNFCLPIAAALTYSANDVIGYDVVLNYDATKVTPTGSITVNGAMITPSFVSVVNSINNGTMNISASILGIAPVNTEWNGNGDIFCVHFVKNNANFAAVETTTFSVSSLQESYFTGVLPKQTSNGTYTTYRDTTFDATLKFWSNNSPLAYDAGNPNSFLITNIYGTNASCVTSTAAPVQPNLSGEFTYNILNGSSIAIQRDILAATPVQLAINNGDQTIARNVLLNTATGTLTPSVYQMIALDVNLDGVISSGDLTQINQRAVMAIPEFKQTWNYNAAGTNTLGVNSKDWIFVDSLTILNDANYAISATFPANDNVGYSKAKVPVTPFCLTVPQTSLNTCPTIDNAVYRGIMVGDATGNFAALNGTLQLRPNGDKVVIDLEKAIVNGKTIEVPVSFKSATPVLGLDFAMKFDESNMSFNSMVNYPSTTDALAYFHPTDRTLRFTCTNVNNEVYSADKPVAYIRFETANGVIDADQFNSLLGILNGEQVAIEVLSKTTGIDSGSAADNSVSVFPNPTNGILNVTSVSEAKVELCDVTGKQVLLQTTVGASQTQQINVSSFVDGVYVLKVYNNDFITIKKVVLNK